MEYRDKFEFKTVLNWLDIQSQITLKVDCYNVCFVVEGVYYSNEMLGNLWYNKWEKLSQDVEISVEVPCFSRISNKIAEIKLIYAASNFRRNFELEGYQAPKKICLRK